MSSANIDVYMPVVIMMALAVIVVFVLLGVSSLVRSTNPSELKGTPYECGEEPEGSAWSAFNMRFYVVGLIFIIFDVESVLMFPIVSVFKELVTKPGGGIVLVEVLIFLGILVSGIAYCWRKGDLDWVKTFQQPGSNDKAGGSK